MDDDELKSVLDVLYCVMRETCNDCGRFDSKGNLTYAEAIRLLSTHGYVDIDVELSRKQVYASPIGNNR